MEDPGVDRITLKLGQYYVNVVSGFGLESTITALLPANVDRFMGKPLTFLWVHTN